MNDTAQCSTNDASNDALYTPLTPLNIKPLPIPQCPTNDLIYPQNMNDLNSGEMTLLYTNLVNLVAHTGYTLAKADSALIAKKQELDRTVTIRFVHDTETKSTTERRERARCSSKTMALQSEVTVLSQDVTMIRALLEGYKTKLFSVKSELERRRHE
jgi:hypothetical protein